MNSRKGISAKDAAGLIESEIVPVVGCTEPASIAFALVQARRQMGAPLDLDAVRVELRLSLDVRRNASTAVLPFVKRRGLKAVAAAGLLSESNDFNPFLGLDARLSEFNRLIARQGWLKIVPLKRRGLFLTARLAAKGREVEVTVSGRHDTVTALKCDRETVYRAKEKRLPLIRSLDEIAALARRRTRRLEELALGFIHSQVAADEKLTIDRQVASLIRGRMTGAHLPVVTFTGSGNQGIFLGVPLRRLYRRHGRKSLPAIVFTLLTQIYLTQKHRRLSGACGIATKAAPSLAAGMAFFKGARLEEIRRAMREVTGRLETLQCPGALPSCGIKARQSMKAITSILPMSRDFISPLDVDS